MDREKNVEAHPVIGIRSRAMQDEDRRHYKTKTAYWQNLLPKNYDDKHVDNRNRLFDLFLNTEYDKKKT